MIALKKKTKSVEDYLKLAEGDLAQLIQGEIIMSPAPKFKHQDLLGYIYMVIRTFVSHDELGKVVCAPIDVFINQQNVLQPDIVFVANNQLHQIKEDGIHGAPTLVIEILSPSTAYYDTKTKKQIYEAAGVKEFWIVDPEDGEAIGFELKNGKFEEFYNSKHKIEFKCLKLEIDFLEY